MAWGEWKVKPKGADTHYVYAIFCQDECGPGYIKFGRSRRIMERLREIRTACPVPVKMFAVCEIGPERPAMSTERQIHRRFEHRRIKGEWYRFTFSDPDDKRDFNDGTQAALMETVGRLPGWTKISVKEFDRWTEQRREAMLRSGGANRAEAKKARQRELAAYRNGLRSDG